MKEVMEFIILFIIIIVCIIYNDILLMFPPFISIIGWGFLTIRLLQLYYIRKNNKLNTFVVRFKNGITHYIDLPEKTTRDELIECVIRISDEEEKNIIGIYNIYGEELEYVEGVWVEK